MGCLWIVAEKFYATFGSLHFVDIYRVGQKKVSLIVFAITLSTASQFS